MQTLDPRSRPAPETVNRVLRILTLVDRPVDTRPPGTQEAPC